MFTCADEQTSALYWVLVVVSVLLFTVLWAFGLQQLCREERARLDRIARVGVRHYENPLGM